MTNASNLFIQDLQRDLHGELPGRAAQYRMAPAPRHKPWKGSYDQPAADAREGGVLLLLYESVDLLYLPLILRPTYRGVHSGQVSLPGGGREDCDANLVATALREAHEEIGVVETDIQVLGQLSPLYVFASNYLVQPVVGWTDARPSFQIDPHEVAELIEIPLTALADPSNHFQEEWVLRDRKAVVPHFRICGHNIWGATAMMLSELLALPSVTVVTQINATC